MADDVVICPKCDHILDPSLFSDEPPPERRKPEKMRWETWVERQIRESMARGEFDNLPGAGKPIADLDRPYDELWWLRRKLRACRK